MSDPRSYATGGTLNANVLNFKTLAEQIAALTLKALLVDAAGRSIVADGAVPVSGVTVEQGSAAADAAGPMVQAMVDDSPPSYIDGEVRPLSLNSQGRLRVAAVIVDPSEIWDCILKSQWVDDPWAKGTW